MKIEDAELGVPYKSSYDEYMIVLDKEVVQSRVQVAVLRFRRDGDGHIRLIAAYETKYDVETGKQISDKFVDLLFNKTVVDYMTTFGGEVTIDSSDPFKRRKEIFDVLFTDW